MARKDKVMAIIAAAIQSYIQDEEAMTMASAAVPAPAAAVQVPAPVHNLWGLAGRQAAMQHRVLLQRRSLK